MKLSLKRTLPIFLLLSLLTFVPAVFAALSVVVATINEEPITAEDMNWAVSRIERALTAKGTPVAEEKMDQFYKEVLRGLMRKELLYHESLALGYKIDTTAVENEMTKIKEQFQDQESFDNTLKALDVSVGTLRRSIMRAMATQWLVQTVFSREVVLDKREIEQFYRNNSASFDQPELVRAREILISIAAEANDKDRSRARQEIEKLRKKALAGEDFASLARNHSDGPSAAQGGDLGYFPREQLIAPIDDAAFALDEGQISEVIESSFGFHVLQGVDHLPARRLEFAEVKDRLTQQLIVHQATEKAKDFAEERLKSANIKFLVRELEFND